MLDELKEEGIVNKVGGRFKLSTLIQKRMIMLNQGYKPLVDLETGLRRTLEWYRRFQCLEEQVDKGAEYEHT